MDKTQARQTTKTGVVIGTEMKKTVKVLVERPVRHPLYKKIVRVRKKFLAHDEYEKCKIGDTVRIVSCRPVSKTKRWRVQEIIGLTPASAKKES